MIAGVKKVIEYYLNKSLIDRVFRDYIEPYQEQARELEKSGKGQERLYELFKKVAESKDVAKACDVHWRMTGDMEAFDTIFSNAAHKINQEDLLKVAQVIKYSPVFKVIDQYTGWANDVRRILENRINQEDLIEYKKLNI